MQNGFVNYFVVTNDIVNEIVAMECKVLNYLESWRLYVILILYIKLYSYIPTKNIKYFKIGSVLGSDSIIKMVCRPIFKYKLMSFLPCGGSFIT